MSVPVPMRPPVGGLIWPAGMAVNEPACTMAQFAGTPALLCVMAASVAPLSVPISIISM